MIDLKMGGLRINMRFPGERVKALTFSYDDQSEQDIRLIDILNKNGLKGTFNVSSGLYSPEGKVFKAGENCRRMTRERCIELYKNSGHEVAVHAYSHPYLNQLPPIGVTREVISDRINHEADYGTSVRGMAYPFGDYSCTDEVVNALRASGIVYSRMTSPSGGFRIPTDWLRWHPTCKHTEKRLMEYASKFISNSDNKEPMLFYLWGHSFEFDKDDNWSVIEEFCKYMGNREDIWYATNIEIYDYVDAYNRLVWNADMKAVYNPSAIDVCIQRHVLDGTGETKRTYTLRSGETIRFD